MKIPTKIEEMLARRRWRYLLIALVAFAIAYAVGAIHPVSTFVYGLGHDHSVTKWFIGISYELIGAIIVALLIDHHFSVLGIREHPRLNFRSFFHHVERAHECVRVLDIWMKTVLLTEGLRKRFKRALLSACRNGVHEVVFIVVDPSSEAAKRRAAQLAGRDGFAHQTADDILADMHRCVELLKDLKAEICAPNEPRFLEKMMGRKTIAFEPHDVQIRFLQEAPSLAVHEVDGFAYFAFFPANTVSADAPQLSAHSYRRAGNTFFTQFREIMRTAVPLPA